jgi:hypothetical protein
MPKSGGDIIEITYNNPDFGSGVFYPKSSEDSTYDLGGYRTSDDANMITGAGEAIYQVNRVRWTFEVKCAWDFSNEDLEALSNLSAATSETQFTFTNVNGVIYKAMGKMVGDIKGNGNSATVDIKASGGGYMQIL